jgi:hypothetical protein
MNLQRRLERLEQQEKESRGGGWPPVHVILTREGEPEEAPKDLPEGTQIVRVVLVRSKWAEEDEDYEPSELR